MVDIARQLLSHEAARKDGNSETTIPAACRVLEALRQPLCTLMGVQGYRVLLTRALNLAKAKEPNLSAVEVKPDGSLAGLSHLTAGELSEAVVILTAQLLGLLATFIGKDFMLRILLGVWPDLTIPATNDSEKGEL